jgi:UDP-glucuronate 4-epimerase
VGIELIEKKILITGPTSQVAFPLARELAKNNDVFGLARFQKQDDVDRVEALGVTTLKADLADDSLTHVPEDFDYVLHFAVVKTGDFEYDMRANAEGVGRLMSRCRQTKAFLHVSSGGVYQYAGDHLLSESDPLGDNHRAMMPTYSLCKIAAESVARFSAREWNIPTTIARFSVPYGNNGGWPWFHLMMMKGGAPIPIHPDQPNLFNPIHEDDYIAQIPKLLEIAECPAKVINWGGAQVSMEEWTAYLGELTGMEPKYNITTDTLGSVTFDLSLMHELVGEATTDWRDGLRRLVENLNPELLKK